MSVSAWGRPHIVKILLQLGTQKVGRVLYRHSAPLMVVGVMSPAGTMSSGR